jgi:hypothetical protein
MAKVPLISPPSAWMQVIHNLYIHDNFRCISSQRMPMTQAM